MIAGGDATPGWGLRPLDKAVGPLNSGHLYMVWDRTGYAGSGLAQTLVHQMAAHEGGAPVLLSSFSLASTRPWLNLELQYSDQIVNLSDDGAWWGDVAGQSLERLMARVDAMLIRPTAVVLDNLNGVRADSDAPEVLSRWAKRIDVPIVAVACVEGSDPAGWRPPADSKTFIPVEMAAAADVSVQLQEEGTAAGGSYKAWIHAEILKSGRAEAVHFVFGSGLFCYESEDETTCPDCVESRNPGTSGVQQSC